MRQSAQQKRLMQEVKHLAANPSPEYMAGPMENDMHTWHFTLRGPPSTEFEEGIYHGRITFPFDYPLSPPDIYFLSKSGRFEVNQKICLTITGFHSDQWNASWTVRSMLEGIISMFPEKEKVQSVGSLNQTVEYRKRVALESWNFECDKCGVLSKILQRRPKEEAKVETKQEDEQIEVPTDLEQEEVNGNQPEEIEEQGQQEEEEEEEEEKQVDEQQQSEFQIELNYTTTEKDGNQFADQNDFLFNDEEKNELEEIKQSLRYFIEANNSQGNPTQSTTQPSNHVKPTTQKRKKSNDVSFQGVVGGLEEMMNVIFSIRVEDSSHQKKPTEKSTQPSNNNSSVPQNQSLVSPQKPQQTQSQTEEKRPEPVLRSEESGKIEGSQQNDVPLFNINPRGNEERKDEVVGGEEEIPAEKPSVVVAEGNEVMNEPEQISEEIRRQKELENRLREEEEDRKFQRAEVLGQVKKIDLMIFLTFFFFLIYLTLTFQISF